jgi:tetratricopeptide (TPR) repeat protein
VLGPDSPSVAGVLLNIANAEKDLQQFEAAERDLDRSALLTEAAFGPDALNLGRVLNNRCEVRFDRHDIAAATKDCERALAIKAKATKPDSPELVTTLMTLAKLADQRGDAKAADAIHDRILAIHLAALGEHHPKVAQDLYDVAERAMHDHRLDEARRDVERGLKIAEEAHEATLTANGKSYLADVALAKGDLAAARTSIREALADHEALAKTTTTPDVPQYLADDHDIEGRIDQAAGDLTGAEHELRRAVELAEPVAGVGQGLLAPHLEHLGALLVAAHKSTEATAVLARTLAILDATAASATTRARVEAELATARGH